MPRRAQKAHDAGVSERDIDVGDSPLSGRRAFMNDTFVRALATSWDRTTDAGVRRQILGCGADLMLVRVEFEPGAVGTLHHHPHRQVSYVVAGRFEVTVEEERAELGPGDCFFVAADRVHGVVARDGGTLIDVFTPAREDFLTAPPPG